MVHVPRRSLTTAAALFVVCSVATVSSLAFSAPAGATVSLRCQSRDATIVGTDGPDLIVGTNGPDVISAGAGDDTIRGLDGNDLICAGAGDDLVNGGLGNDSVMGESWQDEIHVGHPRQEDVLESARVGDLVAMLKGLVPHGGHGVNDVTVLAFKGGAQ